MIFNDKSLYSDHLRTRKDVVSDPISFFIAIFAPQKKV